jgi:chromosome segregation ATPase
MQGDALHAVDRRLSERLKAVQSKKLKLTTLRDRLVGELETKEREVEHLTSEIAILTGVGELFRFLVDQLVEKQVKIVDKVASDGLRTVFPDRDLSLESEVGPKYNKISVEFFFRKGDKDSPFSHRGRPLDAFGGGPSSFVSLLLRIMAIRKLKLWPVLILDESLAAVSDEYIDSTGQFLKATAKGLGFDILLVTHKPSFLDHADTAYRCTEEVEADGVSTYVVVKKT